MGVTVCSATTGIAAALTLALPVQAEVHDYSNTSPVAIPDALYVSTCTSPVSITVDVADTFMISDLDVGIVISHTYDEDIQVVLTSPLGTSVELIDAIYTIGDGRDFNVRLDDEEPVYRLEEDQSATNLYPDVISSPELFPLSAFDGENVHGTWMLTVCDTWPADIGTIEGFHLHISDSGAPPDPLVVTTTADTNTIGTLRYAINHANANTDDDAITFDISGAGPHTITLASALPTITDDGISIDGSTQTGATCGQLTTGTPHDLRIVVSGDYVVAIGFNVRANNLTLKGVSIGRFTARGIFQGLTRSGLHIECNYVGVDPDGVTATHLATADNATPAIFLIGSNSLVIDNNLVSGNADDNVDRGILLRAIDGATITGNIVGLTADGNASLGNAAQGLEIQDNSRNIIVGGSTAATRNVISGNGGAGLRIVDGSSIDIFGNYIGTGRDGSTLLGNGGLGIDIHSGTNITIGGANANDRNIISGNTGAGVFLDSVSDVKLYGNYIGLAVNGSTALGNNSHGIFATNTTDLIIGGKAADEGNVISSNIGGGTEGVWLQNGTIATLLGNFIGTDATGTQDRGNGDEGIVVQDGSTADIGDGTPAGRNVIAGNTGANIYVLGGNASIDLNDNLIGIGTGGEALGGEDGVHFARHSSGTIRNNTIAHNTGDGVWLRLFPSEVAVYSNNIYSNGGLGIDLTGGTENGGGVTANDSGGGDADSGPNDLLNFPEINSVRGNGTASIEYDFDLDVPSNADGYRVEFFKNTSSDTPNGEGEIYLGFLETGNHTGGVLNFSGTLTANEVVDVGDSISATATRMTGIAAYDVTSEFSVNYVAEGPLSPAVLVVEKTVTPLNASDYAIPGKDVIYTFNVRNEGEGAVDTDSIEIIDALPPEITFFNGDYDGAGPSTDRIGFTEASTALTFDPTMDVRFSDSVTRPDTFEDCAYSPAPGYDSDVSFICLNPKGAMASGASVPAFNLSFRARID